MSHAPAVTTERSSRRRQSQAQEERVTRSDADRTGLPTPPTTQASGSSSVSVQDVTGSQGRGTRSKSKTAPPQPPTLIEDEHVQPAQVASDRQQLQNDRVLEESQSVGSKRKQANDVTQTRTSKRVAQAADHVVSSSQTAIAINALAQQQSDRLQTAAPVAKPRAVRRKQTTQAPLDVSVVEASTQEPAPDAADQTAEHATSRRSRTLRQQKSNGDGETVPAESSGANGRVHDADKEETPKVKRIDPATTTMTDLIRERAIGEISEREKKMREIDWDEVARKRREEPAVNRAGVLDDHDVQTPDRMSTAAETPRRQPTMQLRMVDGQIVLDEASQHIDRHAQAILDAKDLVVDENADLTRRVNRMTWINDKKRNPTERVPAYKMKSDPWTDEETDRFYDALRMFGTDFFIISKMFPPKTRHQIKLKFTREEKIDPDRINRSLSGEQTVPMSLSHYATASGFEESDFKDPSLVNEELEAQKQLNSEEIAKRRQEANEAQKQKDIMQEQREREREDRDREKAAQKQRRDEARRRKRAGRNITGTGTF